MNGKTPLLEFWVRRSRLRVRAAGRLAQFWGRLVEEGWETRETGLDKDTPLAAAPAGKGSEQSRNVP